MKILAARRTRLVFFAVCLTAFAASLSADDGASSPLRFSVEVAPNTSGALEGSASLYYRWMKWLESGLDFAASGYTERFDESDGTEVTVLRDMKNVDLNLLRLPVGALALKLGAAETSLGCGVTANGVMIDEDRFGIFGTGTETELTRLSQQVVWLKPLLAVDLEFSAGPFSLTGFFRTSWPFVLNERTVGGLYRSGAEAVLFDRWDEGFETRAGGDVSLELGHDWEIIAGGSWKRHTGHAVEAIGGTQYVYESVCVEASAVLLFPLGKQRVMLGAAFVDDIFRPLDLYSVTPYDNMRVRFIIGTEMR